MMFRTILRVSDLVVTYGPMIIKAPKLITMLLYSCLSLGPTLLFYTRNHSGVVGLAGTHVKERKATCLQEYWDFPLSSMFLT